MPKGIPLLIPLFRDSFVKGAMGRNAKKEGVIKKGECQIFVKEKII